MPMRTIFAFLLKTWIEERWPQNPHVQTHMCDGISSICVHATALAENVATYFPSPQSNPTGSTH